MASSVPQKFWNSPVRYLRWAMHEKPAIFWSCILGALGPVALVGLPPLRRTFGDFDPPRIPLTYPGTFLKRENLSEGALQTNQ